MADIGLRYMAGAKMATEPENALPTYEPGFSIGKMVQVNLSVKNSEGKLYADDELAEYVSEFSEADFTAEVDNIALEKQAEMYGAAYEDGELMHYADEQAPEMGVGGVQVVLVGGVRKFRTWFFAKSKAQMPDWKGATKGESFSLGTQPIKMKVMAPSYGPWYRVKEFATYEAAKAHIDTLLGVQGWHKIAVMATGAGAGEGCTPAGAFAVAEGGEMVLSITGTPTALYDNGEDKLSQIADGKYTVSGVSEDHNIAVIF